MKHSNRWPCNIFCVQPLWLFTGMRLAVRHVQRACEESSATPQATVLQAAGSGKAARISDQCRTGLLRVEFAGWISCLFSTMTISSIRFIPHDGVSLSGSRCRRDIPRFEPPNSRRVRSAGLPSRSILYSDEDFIPLNSYAMRHPLAVVRMCEKY